MIALTPQTRVYISLHPVDFRKGILGLKAVCRGYLNQNPESGFIFLFRNRNMDAIKMLAYDGQGYWLMLKRLSKGRFPRWPDGTGRGRELDYRQLQLIINAAMEVHFSKDWKRLF